jgi:hypothetical protein
MKKYYIRFPMSLPQEKLTELIIGLHTRNYVIDFVYDIQEPLVVEVNTEVFNRLVN